jgi:hypothetical protein
MLVTKLKTIGSIGKRVFILLAALVFFCDGLFAESILGSVLLEMCVKVSKICITRVDMFRMRTMAPINLLCSVLM